MGENNINTERKDQIIYSLLREYMSGITQDGLDILKSIMTKEELAAYGYDLDNAGTE